MPEMAGLLDERAVRRRFAAGGSGQSPLASELEKESAERLREHLEPIRIEPEQILDLGSGQGIWRAYLDESYPNSELYLTDFVKAGVVQGTRRWFRRRRRRHAVLMDARASAIRDRTVDLVTANLLLHWVPDYPRMLTAAASMLRPGGLIMLSALGPDTLAELGYAWEQVNPRYAHIHPFPDMHDIGDQLVRAGFSDVVMDASRITLTYESPSALFEELRMLGVGRNAHAGRPKGLTTPRELRAVCEAYREVPGATDPETGRVRATLEIVFAHAWASEPTPGVAVAAPPLP